MPKETAALIALACFLVALPVGAPARLLGFALVNTGVVAAGYSGSVWRGEVDTLAVPALGQYVQLGNTRWRLAPLSLLLLSPSLSFEATWGQQVIRGDLSISPWAGLEIDELEILADANLARLLAPVKLYGPVRVLARDVQIEDRTVVAGSGRLLWRRAVWQGNRSRQRLGEYVLEFEITDNNRATGQISSLSGPVLVDGSIGLQDTRYAVDLGLRSEVELSDELRSALELMATPTDRGYRLKFSADL